MALFKSTIVIWSGENPRKLGISELTKDAETGNSYCSKFQIDRIADPTEDPDWDGTEFFDVDESDT